MRFAAAGTPCFDINQSLVTCCGVHELGEFRRLSDNTDFFPVYINPEKFYAPGSGLFVATFVNNEDCRANYEALCKHHVLLYQSPVKVNKGSGNKLFLCVFLHKDRKGKAKKEAGHWPDVIERRGECLPA